VSAYDWPRPVGVSRPDDREGRERWNAGRGLHLGGDLAEAPDEPEAAPPAGRLGRPRQSVAKAAPGSATDLWQPIGPLTVMATQAGTTPRVTGRVRDVWVEPRNGRRAYAGAASGGIWYTDDGATTWRAIGGWRPADPAATHVSANPLATGCLWVNWGRTNAGADDPTKDDVWVGTGETDALFEGEPGDRLGGVGILRATDPLSKPEAHPVFVAEATNLVGAGVFRLARRPGASGDMAAATSKGLVERPGGPAPQAQWTTPAGAPKAGDKPLTCTDVVWTPPVGGQPARLWASFLRPGTDNTELRWRADGTDTFTPVTLPTGPLGTAPTARLDIAASPTGDTVWALGDGPRLWRIDTTVAAPTGVLVTGVPDPWDGGEPYNKIAVAVDPSNPARVGLGGTGFGDGAALFLGAVTSPAPGTFRYPAAATSHVGDGVHLDVLAIRFTDDGSQVWVATDGGVFVSTQAGAADTFVGRSGGMAVIEAGFVASHPVNDTAVILGSQDNGAERRIGESLWREERGGDGGGVAFDLATPHRYVAQYTRSNWRNGPTRPPPPVRRGPSANWDTEDGLAEFYSQPATILNGAVNQLAIGTNRVWYTQDWGTNWVTLPTNSDPRNPLLPLNDLQDAIAADRHTIRVLRWATVDRLWVMQGRSLYQLRRVGGVWETPITRVSLEQVFHPAKKTDTAPTDTCNDIAVHDPARGTRGSLYLALNGDLAAEDSDQLWWFDGTDRWFRTGLRARTTAAAIAVAVEPGHPETVYVGTTIGVFRTTISFTGNDPLFQPWTRLDNGLPDVAVQDLSIYSVGLVRLLRAATQARGVWELDLSGPVAPRTYLRVHPYDSRRVAPTVLAAPFEPRVTDPADATKTIPTDYSWHASPDIRIHPRLGEDMPAPAGNLTEAKPAGDPAQRLGFWRLWRFQAALHRVDRRCEATGTWTAEFDAVLRANGAPTPAGVTTITPAFWDSIVQPPNLDQTPWDTASPTEADLAELLPAEARAVSPDRPSVEVPRGRLTVHVLVHHRGHPAAARAAVQVTLLRRLVSRWWTKKSADWLPDPVGWTAAITDLLRNGTAPTLPAGWVLADTANARRNPVADVAAGAPQVATFNVELGTSIKAGTAVMFAAVIHDPADPVSLGDAPLRQLTLDRRHVAVRSVVVR
jgi:hypothetical protein